MRIPRKVNKSVQAHYTRSDLSSFVLTALVVSRVMCKSLCTGGIPLLKHLLQHLLHLREPL